MYCNVKQVKTTECMVLYVLYYYNNYGRVLNAVKLNKITFLLIWDLGQGKFKPVQNFIEQAQQVAKHYIITLNRIR